MLVPRFLYTDRATRVRKTFRRYMQSCRKNMKIIEQRALALSPDHSLALRNCFRLQYLLSERRRSRFEFLLDTKSIDCALFKSLDEIAERVDKGWTEAEEGAIKERDPHYRDISREIAGIQSRWVPDLLTVPLRRLMHDDIYRKESLAHAARIRELERRMDGNR